MHESIAFPTVDSALLAIGQYASENRLTGQDVAILFDAGRLAATCLNPQLATGCLAVQHGVNIQSTSPTDLPEGQAKAGEVATEIAGQGV